MNPKAFRSVFAVFLGMFLAAKPAMAWDATGHQQIADIAWVQLTPHARAEITAILKAGDPKFRPASDSEADVRIAFRKAAVFADVIKGDRTTDYETIIPEMNLTFFKTQKPDPNNNEHILCKTWHYYDTPIRDKGKHPAEDSNALNALTLARKSFETIEKMSTPDRKLQCWWLYWIEHVVGDLHQPLHCVSSYEFFPDTGDAGGNRLRVMDPARPDRPSALHGYWDGGITHAIGADKKASLAVETEDVTKRWMADSSLKPLKSDAVNLDVAAWIKKGADNADTIVYKDLKQNSAVTQEYADAQISFSRKAAILAGTRLAEILNAALP